MDVFLKAPIAVLVVSIFAVLGVFFVAVAIIGKIPRIQLTGKGALSSVEITGRRVYALALFGIVLIIGAARLASYSPADEIAKAREELLSTITVLETKLAEPTHTPRIEYITVTKQVFVDRVIEVTAVPPAIPTLSGLEIDPKNWQTDFCDELCGRDYGVPASSIVLVLVPANHSDALEVLYDVRNSGWVLIKKNITPTKLAGTQGISFSYKGTGAPNSIELKLLLRYPGDELDTTFGVLLPRATDTGDQWRTHQALYEADFECWGPTELCKKHDNTLDIDSVRRLEFGIANKAGDTPGLGKAAFSDIVGIPR